MISEPIYHYFDYKSPYAYLAQENTFALRTTYELNVEWLPYTLDIPAYLGNASLDTEGKDTVGTRNAHQWRRVKYSYMDCRREANRHGLTIKGPKKIFDSRLAHMAFLFVKERGDFEQFHNTVFERFWRRDLDIEDLSVMSQLVAAYGFDANDFGDYCSAEGVEMLSSIQRQAELSGVFGVPSYVYRGEIFWGLERVPRLLEAVRG
ncbi:MAG: DsbA family protein [Gammaproteobacteria bacterium]